MSSNFDCIYVASRRGYKGPRRGTVQNPNKRQATSPADDDSINNPQSCPMLLGAGPAVPPSSTSSPFSSGLGNTSNALYHQHQQSPGAINDLLYRSYQIANDHGRSTLAPRAFPGQVPASPLKSFPERCVDAFYQFFHGAHPFVVPHKWFVQLAKGGGLETLSAAMTWAGSLYIEASAQTRQNLLDEALRLTEDARTPKDGFHLQALMILIVGLDGCTHNAKARELLEEAERRAVDLSMNTRPYASLNGRGLPVLEESWRRTWWDLFIVDGMIAGVHRMTNFLLYDVPADVALPCEEHEFLSGVSILQPVQPSG